MKKIVKECAYKEYLRDFDKIDQSLHDILSISEEEFQEMQQKYAQKIDKLHNYIIFFTNKTWTQKAFEKHVRTCIDYFNYLRLYAGS